LQAHRPMRVNQPPERLWIGSGAMVSVALEPAARFTHAELAALFTAGYEGYFMPVSIDEHSFASMATSWDYDLADSLVAVDGDARVGLCILAVRDADGWIGGVGVVANRRGEGIGEELMRAIEDRARARALERIWLEVLVQNEPAVRLYEKLGYASVRELEVWSLDEGLVLQEHKVPSVAVADAIGRSDDRLPWQRTDATVADLADARAVADERGSLVYRTSGGIASIVQLAAHSEEAIRDLLGSLPSETTGVRYVNAVERDPVSAVLESLGGTRSARQHEMVLELE
jgi:ribosomal protein S18 acetylase RimI-like enzyme